MSDASKLISCGHRRRYKPVEGDVFCLHYGPKGYLVGRVVKQFLSLDPNTYGPLMPASVMIYVYRWVFDKPPVLEQLENRMSTGDLLRAPMFVYIKMFTTGCARVLGNLPLTAGQVLKRHCFEDSVRDGKYVDEVGDPIADRSEPCGVAVISSRLGLEYRLIESESLMEHVPPGVSC